LEIPDLDQIKQDEQGCGTGAGGEGKALPAKPLELASASEAQRDIRAELPGARNAPRELA